MELGRLGGPFSANLPKEVVLADKGWQTTAWQVRGAFSANMTNGMKPNLFGMLAESSWLTCQTLICQPFSASTHPFWQVGRLGVWQVRGAFSANLPKEVVLAEEGLAD